MNRPTPDQLAQYISEDQYGLPDLTPTSPAISNPNDNSEMPVNFSRTEMQACSALSCIYNQSGKCKLRSISINEHGGCGEYEASAARDGEGRYQEFEEPGSDPAIMQPDRTPAASNMRGPHDQRLNI